MNDFVEDIRREAKEDRTKNQMERAFTSTEKHSFLCPCYAGEDKTKQKVCVCYPWDRVFDEGSRRDGTLSYFVEPVTNFEEVKKECVNALLDLILLELKLLDKILGRLISKNDEGYPSRP